MINMADIPTFFVSETTGNEVALGGGVKAEHFLRCMTYFSFALTEWMGQGKKCIDKSKPAYASRDPIDPPLTFPIGVWVEGAIPEPLYFEPYNYWSNTWGWKVVVIREGFAISETSHLFGQYAGQKDASRRSLRELMGTLYTVRHSILNMVSDKERLAEQVKAFKAGNKEQLKGIFVDNYGGQGRTWTEIARNVPLVKSALSWFYKVDTVEEVDAAVKEEKLNPVVANYLKRKIQEFENWRNEYKDWVFSAHDTLVDQIAEQQQNEKLYEAWAKEGLIQSKRLQFDWDVVKAGISDFEFSRFAPKAGYHVDLLFYKDDDQVKQLMKPWHPCVCIQLTIFYNPDLQGWKFTRSLHNHYYGAIHNKDLTTLQSWVNLDIQQSELRKMMALQAGVSMQELSANEEQRKLAKAKGGKAGETGEAGGKPIEEAAAESYWNLSDATQKTIKTLGDTFLLPFGVDVHRRANAKLMRAEAYTHYWFNQYYKFMKSDFGIPHYD